MGDEKWDDATQPTYASGGSRPRWDEGLTKEERAEAKRKYKNRRGAERWRRRKLEQLVRSAVEEAEADGGSDGLSMDTGPSSPEERMLNEHKKLGKAAESDLLAELDQLAAFSILDRCLPQHKREVLQITKRAVNILRGRPTAASNAHRQLELGLQQRPEWNSPSIPNHLEVCEAFAQGRAGSTVVPVTLLASKSNVHRSLERLAALPPCIQQELYFIGVEGIISLLPLAFGSSSEPATAAVGLISERCQEITMLMATYKIGQAGDFGIRRTECQPFAAPIAQLMSAAASLYLDASTCRRLWQAWDDCLGKLAPLQAAQYRIECELEEALQGLEVQGPQAYHRLLEKAEMLLILHEEFFEVGHWLDLKCYLEIFTPFQVGVLAAAQLPRTSARQATLDGIDPLLRMSTVFENGLIPYRSG